MVSTANSEKLVRFMGYFLSKLAREVGGRTGWHDKVFARRYQAIPISEEEAAQVDRLLYILAHGCKEDLVAQKAHRTPSGPSRGCRPG